VGRHNAVDKLIGQRLLREQTDFSGELLLLSGRAGSELIQKAARTGIEVVASLGAPTTLSLEWARASSMVLVGFLGEKRFNVYSGSNRLRLS
jgi:FdhD protein